MKKFFKSFVLIMLILFLIFVVVLGTYTYYMFSKINEIELNTNELDISTNAERLFRYENIAVFAVDSRDISSNVGSRSDGIIIVSIDKMTNDVNLVSVYRDTYVKIPGHGFDKITHAYAFGGAKLAVETLNLNFDLNIEKFVTVNFVSVANIINKLGEIEVEINDEELAELNRYIPDTMENTGLTSNLLVSSGLKSLDGVQAVTYGRIRKITGGDYARNSRMRTIISKTLEKFKTVDLKTKNEALLEAVSGIQTNISYWDLLKNMLRLPFVKIESSNGFPYEVKEVTLNAFYGVPATLESNVIQLHEDLFGQKDYKVSEEVQTISNEIIDKTKVK